MSTWATPYVDKLLEGETVQFRPKGDSMQGKVDSGQLCTVEPTEGKDLEVGDVVLCRVKGKDYFHLIKAIYNEKYQIGNNRGYVNGWISRRRIYGILTEAE